MKKVAIVLSSIGYHWEELFSAYQVFKESGCQITLFTPTGLRPIVDPFSLKETKILSFFGLGISHHISPLTVLGRKINLALDEVLPIIDLSAEEFDLLYLPGGHGCLFDINKNQVLHRVIARMYFLNKVLAGVCHATSTYSFAVNGGDSIVKGKSLTGFSEFVDNLLVRFKLVDSNFLPIPFSNEQQLKKAGAKTSFLHRLQGVINPYYVKVDYPFITGTGPKATRRVARLAVEVSTSLSSGPLN